MSTETSTPIIDAPADAPIESAAPKEVDEQPSTQLESESAATASVAENVGSTATVAADMTDDAPAKEAEDEVVSDVAKTEIPPVNETQQGILCNFL